MKTDLKVKLKLFLSKIFDVWIECYDAMPNECGEDWVIVQFANKRDGFVGIPYIAEYSPVSKTWNTQNDDPNLEDYLNNECKALSWKPIGFSPEWRKSNNM